MMPQPFKSTLILLFFFIKTCFINAQYPPAVGQVGTTAIHADSIIFLGWASGCMIERGPMNIQETGLELASFGNENAALGKAEGNSANVVSLGDGGVAILTFPTEISDKTGWDFAIFENSLNDTFLELAFVEVSSDGLNFFRFPAVSLTDTVNQVGTFGEVDCTKINNLAGKYRQGYGTPFDLAELEGTPDLDLQHVTHLKIIDVVGCVQPGFASFDSQDHKVNDPWPTPFDSGGFDLDGVGIIHSSGSGIENQEFEANFFPNPCQNLLVVSTGFHGKSQLKIIDLAGKIVFEKETDDHEKIDLSELKPGFYVGKMATPEKEFSMKLVKTNF
jgi:hypothetical protein